MNEFKKAWMSEWMNECVSKKKIMNGRLVQWRNYSIKEWEEGIRNERMNEWMNNWMNQWGYLWNNEGMSK